MKEVTHMMAQHSPEQSHRRSHHHVRIYKGPTTTAIFMCWVKLLVSSLHTQEIYTDPSRTAAGRVRDYIQDIHHMIICLQRGLRQRDGRGCQGQIIKIFWLQQPDSSQIVDLNSSNRAISLKTNSQCSGNNIAESLLMSWKVNMKVHAFND